MPTLLLHGIWPVKPRQSGGGIRVELRLSIRLLTVSLLTATTNLTVANLFKAEKKVQGDARPKDPP